MSDMKDLVLELIPHAPKMGLYTLPDIPADKLRNALSDYASTVHREEVLALYDATLLGNAKDGAVFTADRLVFQNNNLEPAQTVRYEDIIHIETRRKLLGGRTLQLDVNRGRATVNLAIDFSAKADAAQYVARFLQEALHRGIAAEMDRPAATQPRTSSGSDIAAVEQVLNALRSDGSLTEEDYERILRVLQER